MHGKTKNSSWEASENMVCDLWQCNFSSLFNLFSWIELCGRLFSHHVKFYSFVFMHKIFTRVCVVVAAVVVVVVAVAGAVVVKEVGKCKVQK